MQLHGAKLCLWTVKRLDFESVTFPIAFNSLNICNSFIIVQQNLKSLQLSRIQQLFINRQEIKKKQVSQTHVISNEVFLSGQKFLIVGQFCVNSHLELSLRFLEVLRLAVSPFCISRVQVIERAYKGSMSYFFLRSNPKHFWFASLECQINHDSVTLGDNFSVIDNIGEVGKTIYHKSMFINLFQYYKPKNSSTSLIFSPISYRSVSELNLCQYYLSIQ